MLPVSIKYDKLGYREACASVLDAQAKAFAEGEGKLHVPTLTLKDQRLTEGMLVHVEPKIFIQTHGATQFTLSNGKFIVNAGEVCLIPRHVLHAEKVITDTENQFCNLVIIFGSGNTISIHFGVEGKYSRPVVGSKGERFVYELGLWGGDFIDKLIADSCSSFQSNMITLRSGVIMFLVWLAKLLRRNELSKDYSQRPLIISCRQFVDHELHNTSLSIPMIAGVCGCSPNHLSSVFHKHTGNKLVDYINALRIKKAKQLLKQTTLQVAEISYACGFRDPTYFSRIFKTKVGHSPRQYRAMYS